MFKILVITTTKMIFMLNFFYFSLSKSFRKKENVKEEQMQKSKAKWNELMQKSRSYFKIDADTSEFIVMQEFLNDVLPSSKVVIVFDEIPTDQQNFPYIILFNNPVDGVERASMMTEQSNVLQWSKPATYKCIMSVLAAYYIFDHQFPCGSKIDEVSCQDWIYLL